ncbi:hypothetical protein [Comamonas terrigena]|uniref:hypothetical protein n=2 Tax=Comamonas TaxID=283 RepID=UPI000A90CEE3|nr:hypothetical protein [Comamonas terrigena]MBD9530992.1 hypothetical protein [Comamonas sp. CMM01]SUY71037.1 Uncharacterised protein [Comamonas terrigena]
MMIERVVDAWIPVRVGLPDIEYQKEFEQGIQDWIWSLPDVLPKLAKEVKSAKISAEDAPPWLLGRSVVARPPWFKFFRVSAHVAVSAGEDWGDLSDSDRELLILTGVAYCLADGIGVALQLSEISAPGCIWTSEGMIASGETALVSLDRKASLIDLPHSDAWPSLKQLAMVDVVDWFVDCEMDKAPFAESRIQRAFAAYTYCIGQNYDREGEALFRAMQGLEAFYCDGVGDLRRQLSDKARLWLGAWPSKANLVGHLYDLRSKFVHGAARLPYRHAYGKTNLEESCDARKMSEGTGLAVRLLLATLQECVGRGVADVQWNFSYTLAICNPVSHSG